MMTLYEQQKAEIATIKDRSIALRLSDADVRRIFDKAGEVGLTVPELLQNFIGDLVDGTYSNGSDEREYANQWLNRCGFHMCAEHTFLRYLIECSDPYEVIREWNDLQSFKEDLAYATQHPDECDPEEVAAIEEEIKYCSESINDDFSVFASQNKENCIGTLEEEMVKVLEWHSDLQKAML